MLYLYIYHINFSSLVQNYLSTVHFFLKSYLGEASTHMYFRCWWKTIWSSLECKICLLSTIIRVLLRIFSWLSRWCKWWCTTIWSYYKSRVCAFKTVVNRGWGSKFFAAFPPAKIRPPTRPHPSGSLIEIQQVFVCDWTLFKCYLINSKRCEIANQ